MVTPDVKIAMTVVAGAIVATIATVLAQLGGSDPWGAPMPLLGLAHACTPWSMPHTPHRLLSALPWRRYQLSSKAGSLG